MNSSQICKNIICLKIDKMKKTFLLIPFSLLMLSLLSTSCGPSKKLVASRVWVEQLQKDSATTHSQLNACTDLVTNLKHDKSVLENQKSSLQDQNASVHSDMNKLSASSKMTIEEQASRLENLQRMIESQKNVMNKLKNTIADALLKYKSDELYVYIKDGNVYVSLQEKLLFKSGSAIVDPLGKAALKSLAQVLNSTKDISVMIEGHTDNIPIKTAVFKDNWDLSTARATSIVRILTIDNGFDPKLITSSGKGEFKPVKGNDTAEGRAANRRTEVILSPDLNELYKLLEQ